MHFQFGNIRVDAEERRVWRDSTCVHITRKAFDLLLLLLEHRPAAVSKAQIHAHLWPDTFVSESSVQALVSEIRQAVGDDGRRRTIVRTVHGVGYAFDAPLDNEPPVAAPSSATAQAWLVGQRERVPLHLGENVLGREGEEVIVIDDSTVSRRHARIMIGSEVMLEDLGSKNGTWLNDERIVLATLLADGASVGLGSVRFTFRLAHQAASTDSVTTPPRRYDPF